MNTIMFKRIGFMFAGGVAGGLLGYFLANLVISKLMEPQEESDWEYEGINDNNTELEVGASKKLEGGVRKVDYTKFADKGNLNELVKVYTEPDKSGSKQDNIRIISLEEFTSDSNNIEMISYYAGDTIFCNEKEEIIPNPEDFFLANIHLHFGEGSGDPDIVYVRNENIGVSYEITRYPGKYSVTILGMPDEEPKTTKARQRKTTKVKGKESIEDEGEE